MIGRLLWWAFKRIYGAGIDVTPEMLDAIELLIAEEGATLNDARVDEAA